MTNREYLCQIRRVTAARLLVDAALIAAALEDIANDRNVPEAQKMLRDHVTDIEGHLHSIKIGGRISLGDVLYA